ncbi:MFS transporter [candidate division WOR-3 bacterium]|nr:MFS transporter [candidate division WOR-3 bacterium]
MIPHRTLSKALYFNIILFGIISFLNDMSSEMIMPILPMFITALGGTGLIVGLVGGLRDSIASILKVFAGFWSDKIGKRKPFIFSGYFISALFKLFLSFSKVWPQVLIFSSSERIGKGLRTAPRDAIIADSVPERKGKGFGIHRAFDTSGAIIGSALAFILFWFMKFGFNQIILIAAILAFVSLIPIHFVKEKKKEPKNLLFKISLKSLPKKSRLFILIATIFGLGNFSYMFFILKAQEFFTGKFAIGIPILLYILFNIFYASFSIPSGILSDRIGKKNVILLGYSLFVLTCLGFAFSHSLISFIILFALYGLVYACIDGNQRAFVSDMVPTDLRATGLGAFHTLTGLVALPASLIAGTLWGINPAITFIFGGSIAFIAIILLQIYSLHTDSHR